MLHGDPAYRFVGGLDIGISKHRSSLIIIVNRGTRYLLVYCRDWRPPKGGKVSLDEIEQSILAVHKRFHLSRLSVDPWQASMLTERLRRQGVPIEEAPQQGNALVRQCMVLINSFQSHA